MAWTLHHLEDLDADFLRYYGREWWDMDGPAFFARAVRVNAYGGVMAVRIAEAEHSGPEMEQDEAVTDLSDLARDPDLAGLVEVG